MADNEPEKIWDEYDWERFLQQQDRKTEKYMELLERFIDDPNRDQIIAREMGWNHLLDKDGREWAENVDSLFDEELAEADEAEEEGDEEKEDVEDGFEFHPLYQASFALTVWIDQVLEEFNELQERHRFLEEQLEDVRNTRRDLMRVIKAVDLEIQTVFASAFADVSTHFTSLFATLFPGGVGRLILTNPDDLLNTGVEVEAKPSGKNVKKLSLLSGGERSLTALAFLFAVFRSRPSPFYVMDEVEAALDDVNLHRFLGLVHEFRREAQLLIVSHQKRTMEAGDSLLGVTMQPGGSSKVVVEKVSTIA